MLKRIIPYAHDLLARSIKQGDICIDATCGNGNDTVFLSELVGDAGHVYAFDIQAAAIQSAKDKTTKQNLNNITYVHDSHAKVDQYIPENLPGTIAGAVFNLGYLPRSDKKIITQADSTLMAIEKILTMLKKHGLIVLVVYYGHDGGLAEKDAVLSFVKQLDNKAYTVIQYQAINKQNTPPFVVAIQKNK